MIERDKEREDATFSILMCVAMILLLFLALFFMYHEIVWSIVIIFALLAYAVTKLVYAGPKKSITGIIAAWIGVGLLILFLAGQLLGPRLPPDPWPTINNSLTGV